MRMVEARITLGVVRAREGAVSLGMRALEGDRKSLPSLLMVSRDLAKVLNDCYSGETQTRPASISSRPWLTPAENR